MTEPHDVLKAEFAAEARTISAIPPDTTAEIAVAGRSNVGKSSLLNFIVQRNGLARTSKTPGCTRGLIFYDVRLRSGEQLRFVDLPGYGFADRSRDERRSWGPLIEHYLVGRRTLACVAVLVDGRRGVQDEEVDLIEYLRVGGVPYVVVLTKVDKVPTGDLRAMVSSIEKAHATTVIATSTVRRLGREPLLRALLARATKLRDGDAPADDSTG